MRRFFHRYAQFGGAASVSEVMWALLVNILVGLGCIIVGGIAMTAGAGSSAETRAIFSTVICVAIGLIYILAALTPTIAVVVRRLHDTGKSGGWCLISLILGGGLVLLILLLMPRRPELFQPEWV